MQNDEGFQFTGFMGIMVCAVILIYAVQTGLASPDVIKSIRDISPYAASHAKQISWLAEGIIILTAICIPPILMFKDSGGETGLVKIGMVVWSIIISFAIIFLIPSIGFLIGVGWFSAKQYLQ